MKTNPFRPNYPITPGMFVGRLEEIERAERHLFQTKAGSPSNFLVTGERGIGKSSFLNYIKWEAEGLVPIDDQTLHFLVLDIDIDQTTSQLAFIKKIQLDLQTKLAKTEKARAFLSDALAFLSKVEAGGIKLNVSQSASDDTLFDEFCYGLATISERICSPGEASTIFNAKYDGILILIDEADNAHPSLRLGLMLKLLLERLHRRGCNKLMVGLAGLDALPSVLTKSHPSALRMFETLDLDRLSAVEVRRVMKLCLAEAERANGVQTTITDEAEQLLANLSEGYPHFIQQFGFSAFEADTDNVIDHADVLRKALGPGGALEHIGDRYYRDDFYSRIKKESYRQVLRIMADKLDEWVTKKEIRRKFRGTDSVLGNAIKALRDRKIILSKPGEPGVYRLRHKGFALWIKFYTTDPADLQKTIESTTPPSPATGP